MDEVKNYTRRDAVRTLAVGIGAAAVAGSAGAAPGDPAAGTGAPLTDAEYPQFLLAAYKRSEIKTPRNVGGLAKDLPTSEMEDLLKADMTVDDEAIRSLALERAAAVRDYLLAQNLSSERLFLGAVKTGAGDAAWKPGAELDLAMR